MSEGQDLTCLQVLSKEISSMDQWYNAVQTQIALTNYPQETAQILQRDIVLVLFE